MMQDVFNVTVTGAGHADVGKGCQDASLSWTDGDATAIIVVSDGHGGERHYNSAEGATLACNVAMEALQEFARGVAGTGCPTDQAVQRLVACIVARWSAAVAERSEAGDVLTFGCTLMAYLQTPDFWLALQIGDGRCVMLDRDGEWSQPVPWDERCMLSMTTSLCDDEAAREFRSAMGRRESLPKAVFLGSDGIDGAFGTGELLYGFYSNIVDCMAADGVESVAQQLPDVLQHYSQMVSRDDMSVACVKNDFSKTLKA